MSSEAAKLDHRVVMLRHHEEVRARQEACAEARKAVTSQTVATLASALCSLESPNGILFAVDELLRAREDIDAALEKLDPALPQALSMEERKR